MTLTPYEIVLDAYRKFGIEIDETSPHLIEIKRLSDKFAEEMEKRKIDPFHGINFAGHLTGEDFVNFMVHDIDPPLPPKES